MHEVTLNEGRCEECELESGDECALPCAIYSVRYIP